jgi:hypothetical protein
MGTPEIFGSRQCDRTPFNKSYKVLLFRVNKMVKPTASQEFGKYQKGEDIIACTYDNADKAVEAILKRLHA